MMVLIDCSYGFKSGRTVEGTMDSWWLAMGTVIGQGPQSKTPTASATIFGHKLECCIIPTGVVTHCMTIHVLKHIVLPQLTYVSITSCYASTLLICKL